MSVCRDIDNPALLNEINNISRIYSGSDTLEIDVELQSKLQVLICKSLFGSFFNPCCVGTDESSQASNLARESVFLYRAYFNSPFSSEEFLRQRESYKSALYVVPNAMGSICPDYLNNTDVSAPSSPQLMRLSKITTANQSNIRFRVNPNSPNNILNYTAFSPTGAQYSSDVYMPELASLNEGVTSAEGIICAKEFAKGLRSTLDNIAIGDFGKINVDDVMIGLSSNYQLNTAIRRAASEFLSTSIPLYCLSELEGRYYAAMINLLASLCINRNFLCHRIIRQLYSIDMILW